MAACPACRSPRVRGVFGGASTFARCRRCGTLFDRQPLSAAEVQRLYEGREYFVKDASAAADDGMWGYSDDYLADRDLIEAKFDRVLQHLERYVPPGRLLDVGAGPGFLVSAAQQRGWEATGLDLNEWAAEYGRRELGVDVRAGDLADAPFESEHFDAITMMDVVEHVADPDDLLAQATKLLRPGGAMALLTPDAGAWMSRLLGRRWPEVRRPGEHLVLFSVPGLSAALARHGLVASGWHSIGKRATVATLASDVATVAPGVVRRLRPVLSDHPRGERVVEVDPHTKFVLYARKLPEPQRHPRHWPVRVPKQPERLAQVDEAILEELESLAQARHYARWLFDTFGAHTAGARIAEVGAGIGTFSRMMLDAGARELLLLEPEAACADVLERDFAADPRVRVTRDALPDAATLREGASSFDLVVCQNVLEHIGDDRRALAAMFDALVPGGHLALVVPAQPRLFGPLDDAYGHWRRYTVEDLGAIVSDAGFELASLRPMNALGIAGWWAKNQRPGSRVGAGSLRAYETLVRAWRPIEERRTPGTGLSLACLARKPAAA